LFVTGRMANQSSQSGIEVSPTVDGHRAAAPSRPPFSCTYPPQACPSPPPGPEQGTTEDEVCTAVQSVCIVVQCPPSLWPLLTFPTRIGNRAWQICRYVAIHTPQFRTLNQETCFVVSAQSWGFSGLNCSHHDPPNCSPAMSMVSVYRRCCFDSRLGSLRRQFGG